MKITKCVELTDEECAAIEDTVRVIKKILENLEPDESYDTVFCYLLDKMNNGTLPNLITF